MQLHRHLSCSEFCSSRPHKRKWPAALRGRPWESHFDYSPEVGTAPTRTIGAVGVADPSAFSIVTPNAFAGTPLGSGGNTTLALPAASGLKSPAGIGACPLAGITHN